MGMAFLGKLLVVAVGAVLAAVGAGGSVPAVDGTAPSGSTTPPPPGTPPEEQLVLRIDRGVGGFTTMETAFAELPMFLLTGHGPNAGGRVISPGPQIAIYPAPLLPALHYVELSGAEVQAAVEVALRHGLDEDFVDRSLTAVIADVGSTVVRLQLDGRLSTSDVYGLGMAQELLTPELAAEHRRLVSAIDELTERLTAPADAPAGVFEPGAYVIGLVPVDRSSYASADLEPTVLPWPDGLGDQTARCQVIDGATARAILASANQLTLFERTDGSVVKPLVRPALPGSSGCVD
jgi:hypothetical protein